MSSVKLWAIIDSGDVHHSLFVVVPNDTTSINAFGEYQVLEFGIGEKVWKKKTLTGIFASNCILENVSQQALKRVVDHLNAKHLCYNLATFNCRHFMVFALKCTVLEMRIQGTEAKEKLFKLFEQARAENEKQLTARGFGIFGIAVLAGATLVSGGLLAPAACAMGTAVGGVGASATFYVSRSNLTKVESLEAVWNEKV